MKKTPFKILLFLFVFQLFSSISAAQEKFDIVTFTIGKEWEKETKTNSLGMLKTDGTGGNALITIFKPVPVDAIGRAINFTLFWNDVVRTVVNTGDDPQMQPPFDVGGWKMNCGMAQYTSENKPFNWGKGMALLCSLSGNGQVVNVFTISNTKPLNNEVFDFIDSLKLPPSDKSVDKPSDKSAPTAPVGSLIGSWERTSSARPAYADPVRWGKSGHTKITYQFRPGPTPPPADSDGEYRYYEESYGESQIILVEEWGLYKLGESEITLIPQVSSAAHHAKKNEYTPGKLLKKEKRALETVKYRFKTFYRSESKRFNLILQTDAPTKRDGAFSENETYKNAWLFENLYQEGDYDSPDDSPPPPPKPKEN